MGRVALAPQHLGVLNALVTHAVEQLTNNNLPVSDDEQAVAREIGRLTLLGDPGPLVKVTVQRCNVDTSEVDYEAWEISVAGEGGDTMWAIMHDLEWAKRDAQRLVDGLRLVLGEHEVEIEVPA